MSDLTLSQLLALDPTQLHTTVEGWTAVAANVDDGTEEYIKATRDLPYVWSSGRSAEAAATMVSGLRNDLDACFKPTQAIATALRQYADGMTALVRYARTAIDEAGEAGISVDPGTGQVTPPSKEETAAVRHSMPQPVTASEVSSRLAALIDQARRLDDETARKIAANIPGPDGRIATAAPPASLDPRDIRAQANKTPQQVKAWWDGLTPAQRAYAVATCPDVVGWLDGVPATARDEANRLNLDRYKHDLTAEREHLKREVDAGHPSGDALLRIAEIDKELANLGKLESKLTQLGDRAYLLGVDPTGDGKAIVAIGNPDTARHTAVMVPGITNTLAEMPDLVDRADRVQKQADGMTPGVDGDVATIAWLGYDTPELDVSAVEYDRSKAGAPVLDSFAQGLRATHDPSPSHLTVIGHSYGSTVVGEAAINGDGHQLPADDIVTAGSPGMHVKHASDLGIDPHHVWAGSASRDPISGAGPGHGPTPHNKSFGANRWTTDTTGHGGYWDTNTDSLRNQCHIIVGQYDRVKLMHGEAPA